MVSIQVRLTLLFVVIVTLVLGISGSYTQYTLSKELESGSARLRSGVLTRLQTSLPSALWDLDKSKVDSIVAAEMLPPELVGIRVYDASVGLFAGEVRDASGTLVPLDADVAIGGTPVEAPLVFRDAVAAASGGKPVIVGKVIVNFSREQIDAALRGEVRRKVVEVLLLDIILVGALALSLRIVFGPLKQLRDGLFDLATRGSDDVEELPENRRDELGDVIRGFNAVQRKLKSIIEGSRQAEEMARRSQQETAQAMDELRRAQESLLQSERLASLGSLVAGVAHEINTPVGIALTSASVLKEATDAISVAVAGGGVRKTDIVRYLETAGESARLIMNNAYRAAHLIHSFKQIAVDQVSEARRLFELRDYIGEVISSLQPTLKKTRIVIDIDCPPDIILDSYPGALAQESAAASAATLDFQVPAGDLAAALRQVASQSRVILSFTPEQTRGKTSPGLAGRHDVLAALNGVLRGTGLKAERSANGSYVLRPADAAAGGEALSMMPEVSVKAQQDATEGSGAYVSPLPIATATPLGLSVRETPQSVSVITQQRMQDQGLNTIAQVMEIGRAYV